MVSAAPRLAGHAPLPRSTVGAIRLRGGCLLFPGKSDAVGAVLLRGADYILMIIREPLLIIREHGEALFEPLRFTPLVRTDRCLDQLAVFDRFRTILLGRGAEPLSWQASA